MLPDSDRRPSVTRLAASLSHHLGAPAGSLGALCLPLALLLVRHLRSDAADPNWADRDRLLFTPELGRLGQAMSALIGAGEGFCHAPAETLGISVGVALGERMLAARFGRSLVDHRCWMFTEGESLATGAVQEAACLAGQWRLGRLAAIAAVAAPDAPGLAAFAAHGWAVRRAAAADAGEIAGAISAALRSLRPTLIACIGGAPDYAQPEPQEAAAAWGNAGARAAGVRRAWLKRLARHASAQEFDDALHLRLPAGWHTALSPVPPRPGQAGVSTAAAASLALAQLSAALPMLSVLGGSAGWPVPHQEMARPPTPLLCQGGSAALAGMALHGGLLPAAAHRLREADALRPALAASAAAGWRGLHMLVEPAAGAADGVLAGLRAMPNVAVFRPADEAETIESLEIALRRMAGPCVLVVGDAERPATPDRPARTRSARGAYLAAGPTDGADATLIASGPELAIALQACVALAESGVEARVVSLPCWSLLAAQDAAWRAALLGDAPRFGIEPGSGFGWAQWLGAGGNFIGLRPHADEGQAQAQRVAQAVLRHLRGLVAN